jgi:hypothetical protein
MLMTPVVDEQIYDGQYLDSGFGVNALAYRDVTVVNGWFKGVSTDAIWPDERMFYGRIKIPSQLLPATATLNVLGIRYVLADANETVPSSLHRRGSVPFRQGQLVVYENVNAWPDAFVVAAAAEHLVAPPLDGCGNNRLLCTDLTRLAEQRAPEQLLLSTRDGRIDIRLFAAAAPRLLVASQMFRPDWSADSPGGSLATVRVAGGLLGVRIPAGVTAVTLRYRPAALIVSTTVAFGTIAAAVLFLVVTRRRR